MGATAQDEADARRATGEEVPQAAEEVDRTWLAAVLGEVHLDALHRVGADRGLAATLVRARGRRHDGRPLDVVVKLTSAAAARREAWFLDTVAPATPLHLPTLHACVVDEEQDRGAVVLDHVDGQPADDLLGTTPDVRRALGGVLARLHARWSDPEDPVLARVRATAPPRYEVRPARLSALLAERAAELDDDDVAWLHEVAEGAGAAHAHLVAGPRTLVHGDVHLDNVLLVGGRPALLDWEGVRLGTPAEDVAALGRLAVRGRDGEPLVGLDAAVEEYRDLVDVCGDASDPDLDARVRSAQRSFAAGAVNWLGRLAAEPEPRPRVDEVATATLRRVVALRGVV